MATKELLLSIWILLAYSKFPADALTDSCSLQDAKCNDIGDWCPECDPDYCMTFSTTQHPATGTGSCRILSSPNMTSCLEEPQFLQFHFKGAIFESEDCVKIEITLGPRLCNDLNSPENDTETQTVFEKCGSVNEFIFRTVEPGFTISFTQNSSTGKSVDYSNIIEIGRGRFRQPSVTENAECSCPNGFVRYGCNCYSLFVNDGVDTWLDAAKNCTSYGGHLVNINGKDEMRVLKDFMRTVWWEEIYVNKPIPWTFIGLDDKAQLGYFRWQDSSPATYSEWFHPSYASSVPLIPGHQLNFQPSEDPDHLCTFIYFNYENLAGSTNWFTIPCNQSFSPSSRICEVTATGAQAIVPPVTAPSTTDPPLYTACEDNWAMRNGRCYMLYTVTTSDLSQFETLSTLEEECVKMNGTIASVANGDKHVLKDLLKTWKQIKPYGNTLAKVGSNYDVITPLPSLSEYLDNEIRQAYFVSDKQVQGDVVYKEIPDYFPAIRNIICERPALNITVAVECMDMQFKCTDGTCIWQAHVCNGNADCADESDEKGCKVDENELKFTCRSGEKIPVSKYCDHSKDCSDGSDESECVYSGCPPNKFACTDDGQVEFCIPKSQICDMVEQCPDGRDEIGCNCTEFSCSNGKCIPNSHVHDLYNDCGGEESEDELLTAADIWRGYLVVQRVNQTGVSQDVNIDPYCSDSLESRCRLGHSKCFKRAEACIYDYGEHGEMLTCRDGSHLQDCNDYECPGMYKCPGSYCLPIRKVCDGYWDCPNGEEEEGCSSIPTCPGLFHCQGQSFCISQTELCDGIVQCPFSQDDEQYCPIVNTPCPTGCVCSPFRTVCEGATLSSLIGIPPKTRVLSITNCNLNLTDATFSNYPYLYHLDLSNSSISEIGPGTFSRQRNLQHLDMSHNNIKDISKDTFSAQSNLRFLSLRNNAIGNLDANSSLSGLSKLEGLFLQHNKILSVTESNFAPLTSLKTLDLSDNTLTSLPPNLFIGTPRLETLLLQNCSLNSIDNDTFAGLSDLSLLDIRNNSLSDLDSQVFRPLRLDNLKTDSYRSCCAATHHTNQCTPGAGPYAIYNSCKDLIAIYPLQIIVWILAGLAAFGNLVVLIVMCCLLRKDGTVAFIIINMCVAGLLMAAYLFIIATHDYIYRGSYLDHDFEWRSSVPYSVAGFFCLISCLVFVFGLFIFAIERIRAVTRRYADMKMSLIAAVIVFFFAWAIFCIAAAIHHILNEFGITYLWIQDIGLSTYYGSLATPFWFLGGLNIYNGVFLGFIAFLLLLTLVLFLALCCIRDRGDGHESRFAKSLILIFILNFICWIPVAVFQFIAMAGLYVLPVEGASWIALLVIPFNAAIDPYLYIIIWCCTRHKKMKGGYRYSAGDEEKDDQEKNPDTFFDPSSLGGRSKAPEGGKRLSGIENTAFDDENAYTNTDAYAAEPLYDNMIQREGAADVETAPTRGLVVTGEEKFGTAKGMLQKGPDFVNPVFDDSDEVDSDLARISINADPEADRIAECGLGIGGRVGRDNVDGNLGSAGLGAPVSRDADVDSKANIRFENPALGDIGYQGDLESPMVGTSGDVDADASVGVDIPVGLGANSKPPSFKPPPVEDLKLRGSLPNLPEGQGGGKAGNSKDLAGVHAGISYPSVKQDAVSVACDDGPYLPESNVSMSRDAGVDAVIPQKDIQAAGNLGMSQKTRMDEPLDAEQDISSTEVGKPNDIAIAAAVPSVKVKGKSKKIKGPKADKAKKIKVDDPNAEKSKRKQSKDKRPSIQMAVGLSARSSLVDINDVPGPSLAAGVAVDKPNTEVGLKTGLPVNYVPCLSPIAKPEASVNVEADLSSTGIVADSRDLPELKTYVPDVSHGTYAELPDINAESAQRRQLGSGVPTIPGKAIRIPKSTDLDLDADIELPSFAGLEKSTALPDINSDIPQEVDMMIEAEPVVLNESAPTMPNFGLSGDTGLLSTPADLDKPLSGEAEMEVQAEPVLFNGNAPTVPEISGLTSDLKAATELPYLPNVEGNVDMAAITADVAKGVDLEVKAQPVQLEEATPTLSPADITLVAPKLNPEGKEKRHKHKHKHRKHDKKDRHRKSAKNEYELSRDVGGVIPLSVDLKDMPDTNLNPPKEGERTSYRVTDIPTAAYPNIAVPDDATPIAAAKIEFPTTADPEVEVPAGELPTTDNAEVAVPSVDLSTTIDAKAKTPAVELPTAVNAEFAVLSVDLPTTIDVKAKAPAVELPTTVNAEAAVPSVDIPKSFHNVVDVPTVELPTAVDANVDAPTTNIPIIAAEAKLEDPDVKLPTTLDADAEASAIALPTDVDAKIALPTIDVPFALNAQLPSPTDQIPIFVDDNADPSKADLPATTDTKIELPADVMPSIAEAIAEGPSVLDGSVEGNVDLHATDIPSPDDATLDSPTVDPSISVKDMTGLKPVTMTKVPDVEEDLEVASVPLLIADVNAAPVGIFSSQPPNALDGVVELPDADTKGVPRTLPDNSPSEEFVTDLPEVPRGLARRLYSLKHHGPTESFDLDAGAELSAPEEKPRVHHTLPEETNQEEFETDLPKVPHGMARRLSSLKHHGPSASFDIDEDPEVHVIPESNLPTHQELPEESNPDEFTSDRPKVAPGIATRLNSLKYRGHPDSVDENVVTVDPTDVQQDTPETTRDAALQVEANEEQTSMSLPSMPSLDIHMSFPPDSIGDDKVSQLDIAEDTIQLDVNADVECTPGMDTQLPALPRFDTDVQADIVIGSDMDKEGAELESPRFATGDETDIVDSDDSDIEGRYEFITTEPDADVEQEAEPIFETHESEDLPKADVSSELFSPPSGFEDKSSAIDIIPPSTEEPTMNLDMPTIETPIVNEIEEADEDFVVPVDAPTAESTAFELPDVFGTGGVHITGASPSKEGYVNGPAVKMDVQPVEIPETVQTVNSPSIEEADLKHEAPNTQPEESLPAESSLAIAQGTESTEAIVDAPPDTPNPEDKIFMEVEDEVLFMKPRSSLTFEMPSGYMPLQRLSSIGESAVMKQPNGQPTEGEACNEVEEQPIASIESASVQNVESATTSPKELDPVPNVKSRGMPSKSEVEQDTQKRYSIVLGHGVIPDDTPEEEFVTKRPSISGGIARRLNSLKNHGPTKSLNIDTDPPVLPEIGERHEVPRESQQDEFASTLPRVSKGIANRLNSLKHHGPEVSGRTRSGKMEMQRESTPLNGRDGNSSEEKVNASGRSDLGSLADLESDLPAEDQVVQE